MMGTSCIILCGGEGSRMGGVDKGLIKYQGNPLVANVIMRVKHSVDDIVLSANRNHDEYLQYAGRVVSDTHAGFSGPLAGIAACLPHCLHPRILVVACDMPALPTDLVARLTVALAHHSIAVARCEQRLQLAMLLTPAVLDSITQLLRKGDYRLMNWLEQQPCAVVDFSDASAFANINTADDLAALS